jgi:ABC-2 type transport system ATP-binding protein
VTGVVDAEGVTKWYGEVLGLNGFTASLGKGITGLVGPNGAGKSTLFKLLVGQLRRNRGTLRVLGEEPWNNVALRPRIGYCPEANRLYGWLSGEAFLVNLLRLHGWPRDRCLAMAREALDLVGLTAVKDRKLATYSRGMRQRAKLAQALAHGPELLVLDEPLSGADPLGRVQILETIRRLAREGRHVIMATHVLYEVERVTSQVVLIHGGQALAAGDVHAIRSLIDAHPHTVRLATPTPREVGRVLGEMDHVVALEFTGPEELTVRTRKPETFYRELPPLVVEGGLDVRGVESPDDDLEAVFRYLVG